MCPLTFWCTTKLLGDFIFILEKRQLQLSNDSFGCIILFFSFSFFQPILTKITYLTFTVVN